MPRFCVHFMGHRRRRGRLLFFSFFFFPENDTYIGEFRV